MYNLRTACNDSEKFKDLESIMKSISKKGVVPEEFKMLYSTFMDVICNGSE